MGGKTISTSETRIEALQLQSSAYGVTVALCYGLAQFPGNLVWYGGFKAIAITQSQGAGGKGGVKTQNTTFTYSASVIMGLCHGIVAGIPRVWKGKQQFTGGITPAQLLSATETNLAATGATFTVANAAAWRSTSSVIAQTGSGDNLDTSNLAEGVHYTVAAGVYTWLAPANGLFVSLTYQYTSGGVTQSALTALGLTFIRGTIGQAAWSALTTLAPAQAIGYSGMALVAGQDYSLGTGAQVDNHLFEVQGPLAYSVASTTPDADAADFVPDVLLNARYGASFPAERLAGTVLWGNYNRASGLLFSPALTEQVRAADFVSMACRATNTAAVWSAGRLKFVPFGDAALTGNGHTYTPNVTPLYDLNDDHFIDGSMPVDVQAKPPSERYNHVRIEFRDRGTFDATKQVYTGQYAVSIADAKDQADIEANGLRSAAIEQMHWICDAVVARQVAQLLLQRSLFVTNTYVFHLPWTFGLVEPMDLVTLTDADLGLVKKPVRITGRQEDEEGSLTFTAEDFPLGIAAATLYPSQVAAGFAHDYNVAPGATSTPLIIEAPGALVSTTGLELYVAAAGAGANWGGCRVWVSLDGTTYRQIARLSGPSRYGQLTGAIAIGVLPVSVLAGQLLSGSAADAAQLSTLCFVGGANPEFLAYQTATLTGALAYNLSGLIRGAYGTATASAHANGDAFMRIDDAIARSGPLDLSYIGKTVHVKCTSFNQYGGAEESLASVADTTYTITGSRVATQPAYLQADMQLVNGNGMTITGNAAIKTAAAAAWDSSFRSRELWAGGAFVSFVPSQSNAFLMVGLNADPALDNSYTSLDFAWYCLGNATLDIYESNSPAGLALAYAAGDVLAVLYDGVTVKYLQNGIVRRTVSPGPGLALAADSSFNHARRRSHEHPLRPALGGDRHRHQPARGGGGHGGGVEQPGRRHAERGRRLQRQPDGVRRCDRVGQLHQLDGGRGRRGGHLQRQRRARCRARRRLAAAGVADHGQRLGLSRAEDAGADPGGRDELDRRHAEQLRGHLHLQRCRGRHAERAAGHPHLLRRQRRSAGANGDLQRCVAPAHGREAMRTERETMSEPFVVYDLATGRILDERLGVMADFTPPPGLGTWPGVWSWRTHRVDKARGCMVADAAQLDLADVAAVRAEELGRAVKADRDRLLAASDWTQLPDAPLAAGDRAAWASYRTALRGVPAQVGFPVLVDWPALPKEAS